MAPAPTRVLTRARLGLAFGLMAVAVGVAACAGGSGSAGSGVSSTTVSDAGPAEVTSSSVASSNHTLGPPMAVPESVPKPAVCGSDMGTTLEAKYFFPDYYDERGRRLDAIPYDRPPEEPFDWNGDGQPDSLTLADDTVTITWAGGQLVVTGVATDLPGRIILDDDERPVVIPDSKVVYDGPTSDSLPAAVGDVTGDGLVDLVVLNRGHTHVLIGEGADNVSETLAFDEVGRSTLGWQSPPFRPPSQGRVAPNARLKPDAAADVRITPDFDHDGAADFAVLYYGRRGARLPTFFAGVPCRLPSG